MGQLLTIPLGKKLIESNDLPGAQTVLEEAKSFTERLPNYPTVMPLYIYKKKEPKYRQDKIQLERCSDSRGLQSIPCDPG